MKRDIFTSRNKPLYTEEYIKECLLKVYGSSGFTSTGALLLRVITGNEQWSARDFPQLYTEEEVRQLFINRSEKFSSKIKEFREILLKQDLKWFEEIKKKP